LNPLSSSSGVRTKRKMPLVTRPEDCRVGVGSKAITRDTLQSPAATTNSPRGSREHNALVRLAITMLVTALFGPPSTSAQTCTGNTKVGCTNSGAVCSPVTTGVGPTGHCTTPPGLPPGEKECVCEGAPALDLTGTWAADDGAIYYLRQIGTELWWAGLSVDTPAGINDLQWGLRFTNVFQGHVSGNTVTGDWADVPRGLTLNSGTLALAASVNQIQRQSATGGFGATLWNRTGPTFPHPNIPPLFTVFGGKDIFAVFNLVKKNQNAWRDHSLLDNLKPAKNKPVVIFGNIVQTQYPGHLEGFQWIPGPPDPDPMHVNYRTYDDRCYDTFICLDGNDSPPDGDIDFNIQVDRAGLDAQIGFWSDGWETDHGINATNFRNKLDENNLLHIESIMYGGTTECGQGSPLFLLPGWQPAGAIGVLFNGRPIGGQMDLRGGRLDGASTVNSILGRRIKFGDRVRISGILALDCGHGWEHNCDEDNADTQNQEIHPVYALDFVQNFRLPRPLAQLTGAWSGDDAGTYFVRQVGTTVWWLGLSSDEGLTFANVFRGTLQNSQVSGTWADIPLGQTSNSGILTVQGDQGQASTAWNRVGDAGAFSGTSWQKLYDAGETRLVITFESATANGPTWPSSPEPFELVVGNQRVEAHPVNPHRVNTPNAKRSMQAELSARLPLDVPTAGPVRIAARFAGHRANWTIPQSNLKPGVYLQSLTAPKTVRTVAPRSNQGKGVVTDRDATVTKRRATTSGVPRITIRYRIEALDMSNVDRPARQE